jgi:site-specific DNA-methyltransferase (cytosine-N4-specific)
LRNTLGTKLKGKVQLILTSPPFPLNHEKSYGNLRGDGYPEWFSALAPIFATLLTPTGSSVIEMGNSRIPRRPVQSLQHLESLLAFVKNDDAGLRLCQQFICYNPSRLPSPAQWVTVERVRATDSCTHIWWASKTDFPKADNRRVLRPYSTSMKQILGRGRYNNGKRPSEHTISESGFLTRHKGSIPQNLFELEPLQPIRTVRLPNAFSLANTSSNDFVLRNCRSHKLTPHPARMPTGLASFFIEFPTSPRDLIPDPFAGSNTTGFSADRLGRPLDCHGDSQRVRQTIENTFRSSSVETSWKQKRGTSHAR